MFSLERAPRGGCRRPTPVRFNSSRFRPFGGFPFISLLHLLGELRNENEGVAQQRKPEIYGDFAFAKPLRVSPIRLLFVA